MMKDGINLVLLRTVYDEFNLGIIKSILEDNGIPYIVKDKGSGAYMRIISGSSPFSSDIMVDENAYDKASLLLEQISL